MAVLLMYLDLQGQAQRLRSLWEGIQLTRLRAEPSCENHLCSPSIDLIPSSLATQAVVEDEELSITRDLAMMPDVEFIGLLSRDQDFDANYGLVQSEETVIVRAYSDDSDDVMLMELRPRFVVMFDPSLEFLRRMEVFD